MAHLAQAYATLCDSAWTPAAYTSTMRQTAAACKLAYRLGKTYTRPEFAISSVSTTGDTSTAVTAPVTEEVLAARPFCRLVHFCVRAAGLPLRPPVLLVAPLAGHHASLLRETARELLKDHEVYLADWIDAREAPLSAGPFGLDDYIGYLHDFIAMLGPALHIVAVCQATVPVLSAVALMASSGAPELPRSLTLISGPVDPRRAPTAVNRFAQAHPLGWFRAAMIHTVPHGHPGAGRRVYPGFIQHACFVAMNSARHAASYRDFHERCLRGQDTARHCSFYDDYNATLDLPEEFYLDTIDTVFQQHRLARGNWRVGGVAVRPQDIRNVALFTIEGERDDITAPGQTAAALALCSGIAPACKRNYVAPGCGQYATFAGQHFLATICPAIRDFISDSMRTHAKTLQAA